jgi:SSS family solute:Na+ symporter
MAMLAALFSAMLSSADSCLITAVTVLCNDVFRRRNAWLCRTAAFGLGLLGWLLAAQGHSILRLMLAACDICMCGLLGPLLAALFARRLCGGKLGALAIAAGGACGLASSVTGSLAFTCLGVILSAVMVWADR